jgi:hypothetical protein
LLDILFEKVHYEIIVEHEIASTFIPTIDPPMIVSIPGIEDITGDKLTAFAPNTTGIPYFKGKDSMSMEIIKQLYDIGNLFDKINYIDIVKLTFTKIAQTELAYRELHDLTEQDVLDDIYQTALCIISRGTDGKGEYSELLHGIKRIKNFVFTENYHIEKATVHASKAAYLSVVLKYGSNKIEKYAKPLQMNDWVIEPPFNVKYNKLKKSNLEAFFYLYKTHELIGKKD